MIRLSLTLLLLAALLWTRPAAAVAPGTPGFSNTTELAVSATAEGDGAAFSTVYGGWQLDFGFGDRWALSLGYWIDRDVDEGGVMSLRRHARAGRAPFAGAGFGGTDARGPVVFGEGGLRVPMGRFRFTPRILAGVSLDDRMPFVGADIALGFVWGARNARERREARGQNVGPWWHSGWEDHGPDAPRTPRP